MVSKRYYRQLVLRVTLLSLSCLLLCLSVFFYPNYSVIIILSALFIAQAAALIRYQNQINKKLENFFLFYLSGDVASSNIRRSEKDAFSPLYMYFDLVTEKLEQARLKNEVQNTYFKTIVDETAVGLISFKADGSVELFNEAARKMFGMQVLRNLRKLDTLKEDFSETLINMKSDDRKLITLILNSELIQLATKKVKFRIINEELHLVSFQNIKPELEEREILAWQRLIRVLMHEISNSITPMLTLAGAVKKRFRPQKEEPVRPAAELSDEDILKSVKELDLIDSRGWGLIHFIENYRSITKLPKPQFQIVNLRDLLQRVVELQSADPAYERISLTVVCRQSVFINVDGKLLEQVLINLVKNSFEALEDIENPIIQISGFSSGEQIMIQVTDNGKGIQPDQMDQIFVPFFTTKQKGSGIGLSLSHQIIRLHGGSLTVQSAPGNTVFTIRI